MKYIIQFIAVTFLFVCVFGVVNKTYAQDTLDVAQGLETLNLAVKGDTSATGEPMNMNRVWRLERGGLYILNGAVRGLADVPLRVVGAEGDGPLPILIGLADETGSSDRLFRPNGDGEFKNLYLSGIDNLGNYNEDNKNTLRMEKDGGHYVVDNCFFDYNYQSFFRMNSDNQDLIITNSTFRNCGSLLDPGDSKMIDTRGNHQDSIVIRNTTMYGSSGRLLRSDGSPFNYLEMDHVTAVKFGGSIEMEKVLDAKITNNIFIDIQFEGRVLDASDPADTTLAEFIDVDSLDSPSLKAEEDRHITISNNVYAISPVFQSWYDSVDSLHAPVFLNQNGMHMVNTFPNIVAENNINALPTFSDQPENDILLTYSQYRLSTNYLGAENPSWFYDRNGLGVLATNPETFGLADDDYDFDYLITDAAYTAAEGGLPAGDLNWFPGIVNGIEDLNSVVPSKFELLQNYPNPFNPSTSITFRMINRGQATLSIYNVLGQNVRTLINNKLQDIGTHSVQWDGRDGAGRSMPSGMYFYRLESAGQIQQHKMLLLK